MNKYFKGKKVIYATERAFEIIYKAQGFRKAKSNDESVNDNESTDNKEQENDEK